MLVFVVVQIVGYLGFLAAKRIAVIKRGVGQVELVAAIWAIVSSFAMTWSFDYAILSAMSHSGNYIIGIAIAGSFLILLYVYLGLGRLWPGGASLGFPQVCIPGLALGAAVGCVLMTALSPQVWASVVDPPYWLWNYVAITGIVPISILEEAVFRGRVMEVLSRRIRSPEVVLLFQAVLFTALHMIPVSSMGGRNTAAALRKLSIIMLTAYAYGVLRQRTRGLWAPVGAHVVYNILAILNNMDTIGCVHL